MRSLEAPCNSHHCVILWYLVTDGRKSRTQGFVVLAAIQAWLGDGYQHKYCCCAKEGKTEQ